MARFLVVDDDASSVRGLSQLLASDGHEVAPFTAGADAIEALSRDSFDAVVTDLEMPRVDGHAVVEAARKLQPKACVVVATARGDDARDALMSAGACMVADKPIEYAEIAKEVADCRARGGPGRHGRCPLVSRPDRLLPLRRK